MSKVKSVSTYDGTQWGAAVPLGANDENIDITATTTDPSDSTNTVASLSTADVTVASGDTDASAWTKFNRFRKRVANNFNQYMRGSLVTSYNATGSTTAAYSTSVINNYMSNVIGYTGTSAPSDGSVASQLSNKVSKAGDTMTGSLVVQSPNLTNNTPPSSDTAGRGVYFRDSNNVLIGHVVPYFKQNGSQGFVIQTTRNINGTNKINYVLVQLDENGDPKIDMSSPPAWRSALGLGTDGALPLTIKQGGTGATSAISAIYGLGGRQFISESLTSTQSVTVSFSGSAGLVIYSSGVNTNYCGEYIIHCSSATGTPVIKTVAAASTLTLTAAAGKVTITSGATSCYLDFMPTYGSVFRNRITVTKT